MGAGYWLNPNTSECVRIDTTHDEWVRDKKNAASIGLTEATCDAIMRLPVTAIDEIRLLALQDGLVRIREHPRYVSVQFIAEPNQITPILRSVLAALHGLKLHPETTLKLDNLAARTVGSHVEFGPAPGDSLSLGLAELEDSLRATGQ